MKRIVPIVIVLGIACGSYVFAAAQLFGGYVTTGRAGNKRKIYASESPEVFWTVIVFFIFVGTIFLLWGLLLVFWNGKKQR